MSQNYRIVHPGGDYPPGSVVPETVFSDPAGLCELGAIVKTKDPANVDLSKSLATTFDEADAQDVKRATDEAKKLRQELLAENGKLKERDNRIEDLERQVESLTEANRKLSKDMEAAESLVNAREMAMGDLKGSRK